MTDTTREDVEVIDVNDLPPDEDGFDPCEEGENLEELVGVFGFGTTSRHVMATWLTKAFDKWGVKYRVVAGWETRGRPISAGYFDPNALLNHHTGTKSSATNPNPSLRTLIEGRSDLKGPLCQVSTGYDGVTTIIAAGRANHAGKARATMGNPAGDGNAMYLANEVATNGTQKMPQVQYDAVVLVNVAILDHFGYTTAAKAGLHHTTSLSGKWDLGAGTGEIEPYDLAKLRADVTARLKAGQPGTPTPTSPKEDAMPALDTIVTVRKPDGTTEEIPYAWMVNRENYTYNAVIRLEAGMADLQARFATVAAGGSTLTPEAAERIYREELAKRLDELKFVDAGDTSEVAP
jgi:hypothetical protein